MLDQLEKYASQGHFFFSQEDELQEVCNAPKNGMGVYIIYALKNGRIELVYIGSSGEINQNGTAKSRIGGIFDRLVNGKQFDEPRRKSWKQKLISEKIDALDIYWFETFEQNYTDIPSSVEGSIIQTYFDIHGCLPKWNSSF